MRKILFVGPMWYGSNARSLANGFANIGLDVQCIDTTAVNQPKIGSLDWLSRKGLNRVRQRSHERIFNKIEAAAVSGKFDTLFCFKTVWLPQDALLSLPFALKVHYSADDVSNPDNITRDYLAHESRWDLIVTTKRHNIAEISERGGTSFYIPSAYDRAWHRPQVTPADNEFDLGFIGAYRPDRAKEIENLARSYGPRFRLAGPQWSRHPQFLRTGAYVTKGAYGESFSEVVGQTLVNLVLLNSANRDAHTCRSYEVPAAGGLFLGERTAEHQEMLSEGAEAYFFACEAEMLDQIERLRRSREQARKVAERGRSRILNGGNSYEDRAKTIAAHM